MQSPLNGIEDKNKALDKTTNHLLSQLLRFETLQIMIAFYCQSKFDHPFCPRNATGKSKQIQ